MYQCLVRLGTELPFERVPELANLQLGVHVSVDTVRRLTETAAAARQAAVLIDERKARSLIDTDPSLKEHIRDAIGTVGLMLLAKRRGQIAEVRPLLDALVRENFWLSPQFYQVVLEQAGELMYGRPQPA